MSCCNCPFPTCAGNCQTQPEVGWEMPAPAPEKTPEVVTPPQVPEQPEQPAPPEKVIKVPGKG
jgi:hypothetical protein